MQSFNSHVIAISYFEEKKNDMSLQDLLLFKRKMLELRKHAIFLQEKKEINSTILQVEDLVDIKKTIMRAEEEEAARQTESMPEKPKQRPEISPSLFISISVLDFDQNNLMAEAERELICQALAYHNGNRSKTARSLGISVRTIRNKLNQFRQEDRNGINN